MRAGVAHTIYRQRSRENIERMYNDDDDEDRGMLCCSRIVLFIIGVVLLGVGTHFYMEAESPIRQEKIVVYDQSVYDWNHEKKAQMEESSFNISIEITGTKNAIKRQTALLADTGSDSPILLKNGKLDEAEEITTYSTLRYDLGTDGNQFLDDIMVNYTAVQTAQIVIQARHGSAHSEMKLEAFPLHHETKKPLYGSVGAKRQHCNAVHGNMDHSHGYMQCRVVSQLKSVCVEVELDAEKKWQLSPASEEQIAANHHIHGSRATASNVGVSNTKTYGCDIQNNYHPAVYTPLKLGTGQTHPSDHTLGPFQFTVRSSADPFLELEILTDGSLYFGLSQHEQRATGGVCIGVGLLLLASPLIYLFYCWRRCKDDASAEASEPLAFTDVSVGSASLDAGRMRTSATSPPVGGDAYINDLVRRHREAEEGYDSEGEGGEVVNEDELQGALKPFAERPGPPMNVPKSNVVPVDDEGEMVRASVDVEMVQMGANHHEDEIPTAEMVQSRRRSGSGGSGHGSGSGSGSGSDTGPTVVRKLDD